MVYPVSMYCLYGMDIWDGKEHSQMKANTGGDKKATTTMPTIIVVLQVLLS